MSPKRVAVLMLLMVGAPLWVTLRSRLGEWMLAALLGVWCLGYGVAWGITQDNPLELPHDVWWSAVMVRRFYESSAWMWCGQVAFALLYRAGLLLRECEARHPWSTGSIWMGPVPTGITDVIGTFVLLIYGLAAAAELPMAARDTAHQVMLVMAGAFVILAIATHANGRLLPMAAPLPKRRRKPVQYLSRLKSAAKRSNEGLGQIFSRRDKALRELTRT